VAASAGKMSELIGEISAASTEQAQGINQVNKAVNEMDKVVQTNAANAEESASAAEEMNAQAEQMKTFVDELVAIVDGSGNGNMRDRKNQGAADRESTAKLNKANGTSRTLQTRAENLIPFGDEESTVHF
jgi:methyl-accepting chemotaxis protein